MSNALDRVSFWSLFCVVVFLPVFFLPFTQIPFETAKGFLLILGLVISIVFWTIARFMDGAITFPRSWVLLFGGLLTTAFVTSAFMSSAREASFFGSIMDFGSASFMFAAFLLMLMCALVVREAKYAKIVILGFILSSVTLFIFQSIRLFFPATLSLGMLTTKTDSIMGSWNALGLFASFFIIICLFIIESFSIPRGVKCALGVFMVLALFCVMAANFYLSWALLELFALFIFIYKISYSYHKDKTREVKKYFPFLAFIVFLTALLFFVSAPSISGFVPRMLGVSNLDASPTFSANLMVAKSATLAHKAFGIGPNRFGEAWAMYKPAGTNQSPFWDNYFDFGAGVLPTFASLTGLVGLAALALFLLSFAVSGFKNLFESIGKSLNSDTALFFVGALFLFAASFFYATGMVLFLLAMAFTGISIGVAGVGDTSRQATIVFSNNPRKSFFFLFLLVGIMAGSVLLAFKYLERFASVAPLRTAILESSNTAISVPAIERALSLNKNDLYYRTAAQIYLLKFNELAATTTPLTEDEQVLMQASLDKAVEYATQSFVWNPDNYLNFQMLGSVYMSAGRIGVKDAYDKALDAYTQASVRNPLNPGIKLALAQIAFYMGNTKQALDFAAQSLALKADYVDGLIVMSQIKKSQGLTAEAVSYAEQALQYIQNSLAVFPDDQVTADKEKDLKTYLDGIKRTQPPEKEAADTKNITKNP